MFGIKSSENMGNEMSSGGVDMTNVSVKTEPNNAHVSTSHTSGKLMDEAINVPRVETKPEIKPVIKKEEEDSEPPPPTQIDQSLKRQIPNSNAGFSFKVCDMHRLRRYIVLGSEKCVFHASSGQNPKLSKQVQNTLANISCLNNLLDQNRYQEVLDTITEYSLSGRVAKEDPILTILALCAGYKNVEVQKAAYRKVSVICNIPTKLFRFLELTQQNIDMERKTNPPPAQKFRKRKIEKSLEAIKISDDNSKEPSESTDTSLEPVQKKKKKGEPVFMKVNRTPKKSSGWGRMRRKAISHFYADEKKDAPRLLYLLTKYKHRHNWSHKEAVGYSHPKMAGENEQAKNLVLRYCTHGYAKIENECASAMGPGVSESMSEIINYIKVIEGVNNLSPANEGDEEKLLTILKTYGIRDKPKEFAAVNTYIPKDVPVKNTEGKKSSIQIVREHIPTGFLKSKKVWEHLLCDMPMTAMIRNLGKMSSLGLFDDPVHTNTVLSALKSVHKLRTARIHPVKILIAMNIYKQGKGERGDLTWKVNDDILQALDAAFYLSFQKAELKENLKTNKKYMLCLDVSGSMQGGGCLGCEFLNPATASAAMAWVTWNVEDNVEVMAFGGHLEDMKKRGFTKDMRINDVVAQFYSINFGTTDCSLPMIHALDERIEVDVFIVYTDSETRSGYRSPVSTLRDYNQTMNRNAKLIVCGMQSNGFTIADPQDPNMMDVVGFDSNVPDLISEFAKGNLSGKCGDNCEDCRIKTQ